MPKKDQSMYDAVIIGAGIGGLVCGCYLAKAGMKVLICEQHNKPGGYCTSFKRKNFTFDAAAHCFGGYREKGITRKVFKELGIDKKLVITKFNPSDTIKTPDYKISFWTDLDQTVEDFQSAFPEEANNIRTFFHFLLRPDPKIFTRIRRWTFSDLLDNYFTDAKLKTILSIPLLGIGGLPPDLMSAFIGAKLFSEFLLDGGYYPEGGMQELPDALSERFKELGGELFLTTPVRKIIVENDSAMGIILREDARIKSKYVISNCDANQTFLKFLGKDNLEKKFYYRIKNMLPSISTFIIYLGMDAGFDSLLKSGTNFWFFPHYNLDGAYRAAQKCDIDGFGGYMLHLSDDKSTILALILASFKNKRYWANKKYKLLDLFIKRIEKYTVPHLSKHIIYKDAATPQTLYRYTLNYRGASFGWAGTPTQLAVPGFKKPDFIDRLYLTGHWTTQGLGVSGVTYVGYDTAKMLLRKEHLN
jgi:phytoene dehydrogenase-like protein